MLTFCCEMRWTIFRQNFFFLYLLKNCYLCLGKWSAEVGCIKFNNIRCHNNVALLSECKEKCETQSGCLSIDYTVDIGFCCLNKVRKEDAAAHYYSPCYSDEINSTVDLYMELQDEWINQPYCAVCSHKIIIIFYFK